MSTRRKSEKVRVRKMNAGVYGFGCFITGYTGPSSRLMRLVEIASMDEAELIEKLARMHWSGDVLSGGPLSYETSRKHYQYHARRALTILGLSPARKASRSTKGKAK